MSSGLWLYRLCGGGRRACRGEWLLEPGRSVHIMCFTSIAYLMYKVWSCVYLFAYHLIGDFDWLFSLYKFPRIFIYSPFSAVFNVFVVPSILS
jgi:hypothetical protein